MRKKTPVAAQSMDGSCRRRTTDRLRKGGGGNVFTRPPPSCWTPGSSWTGDLTCGAKVVRNGDFAPFHSRSGCRGAGRLP